MSNKLALGNGYTLNEIENKLHWATSLLTELVSSIDAVESGHTLQKADRLNAALADARGVLGLPAPAGVTRPDDETPCTGKTK